MDLERLCEPVSAESPCGADLEYDAEFLALEQAAKGKDEQQFGDTVVAAEEPDWRDVRARAESLFPRTKDLRVAALLTRSLARTEGLSAFGEGLRLLHMLCERYWDSVFPALDADYDNDPVMRMNALAPLSHPDAGLRDLRAAVVVRTRAATLTVRDIEVALGILPASEGADVHTEASIGTILADVFAEDANELSGIRNARQAANDLQSLLNDKVGSDRSPDLKPVRDVLNAVSKLAEQAAGSTMVDETGEVSGESADGSGGRTAAPGELRTREDAIRALERVCDFLERTEPTNPAPLFIRRAQRLMGMNFVDIVRELVPDSMSQLENLAGLNRE
jgi:type VI secretion system protein ImpA